MDKLAESLATVQTHLSALDSVAQPTMLNDKIAELAASVGMDATDIKLFILMLLAYPTALMWRHIPGAYPKHLFSILVGVYFVHWFIGHQWLHIVFSSLLCYLSMLLLGPKARYFSAALALLYLAGGHIYRQYTDYLGWTMDFTMQHMVVIQKLSALAFNHYDGSAAGAKHATAEQKSRSVARLPNLIQFFAFIFMPSNILIGPGFEYTDYINIAEGTVVAPAGYVPALAALGKGFVLLGMFQVLTAYFPIWALLTDPKNLVNKTPLDFFTRWGKVWVGLFTYRCKYYFGWKIAEGAGILSGLGYAGVDEKTGNPKFDNMENVDVVGFELSQSLRDASTAWNKTTNRWLRRYIYDRFPAGMNLYITYFVSAFWHGFYPGYYMFFLTVAVATQVHRGFRRSMRPRFMLADGKTPGPLKPAYDVFSVLITSLTVNYFIMTFVTLAWNLSIGALKSFFFVGHACLAVGFVLFGLGVVKPPRKPKTEEKKSE
eukprot:CAMPEP_0174886970 /NCGR_PEP_ID=MMETSP0167-20121228/2193_1 /TAXON_ID=38298 /ORGANISM="Rhodella maculata, Strain CCMP736" /LENGTH=487 /DNA_ID=CAMNT_0016123217 /DNA_START=135 /DNA_END=1598 /DNA_ORIENTATION=+